MSTTENFNVYQGLPYLIKSRANGKWDYIASQIFTTNNQSVSFNMTNYDGLSLSYEESYQSADKVDFSNTILPWKWEYSTDLSTSRYCLMPVGTTYQNVQNTDISYNFYINGTPSINDEIKVVSGFSTSNYIQTKTPFNPGSSSWEVQIKFTTSSDITSEQELFQSCSGPSSNGRYGICLDFSPSGSKHFAFFCSANNSSWLFDIEGSYTILANTTYYVKFGWTGTTYYLDYSLDGETFTRDITYNSSTPIYSSLINTYFGIYSTSTFQFPFTGSIDLSETKLIINGSDWWMPSFTKTVKQAPNATVYGRPSINNKTGVMSGFSSTSYFTMDTYPQSITNMEIVFKVKVGESTGNERCILGQSTNNYKTPQLEFSSNSTTIWAGVTTNGQSPWVGIDSTTVLKIGSWYYVKLTWNGSTLGLYTSTDNINWTTEGTKSCSTINWSEICNIGKDVGSGVLNGSIDFSESYVKIDGSIWWTGMKYVTENLPGCTYNFTDTGASTTLNAFVISGDESVVLTPDNSYTNGWKLGTVNIPEHNVYTYNNGVWTLVTSE